MEVWAKTLVTLLVVLWVLFIALAPVLINWLFGKALDASDSDYWYVFPIALFSVVLWLVSIIAIIVAYSDMLFADWGW